MAQFPTAGHLVSWAKVSPRTIQSGPKSRSGATGKGNPYLKRALGEAAASAARTDTFLGERYSRIVRRRGKQRALVAVARSILVIVWHLLADPNARFIDLGSDYYDKRINKDRRARDLVRHLHALGYQVTLTSGLIIGTPSRAGLRPAPRSSHAQVPALLTALFSDQRTETLRPTAASGLCPQKRILLATSLTRWRG